MSTDLTLDALLGASTAGGPSCWTSRTRLAPAGGDHEPISPAKYATAANSQRRSRDRDLGTYAYQRLYLNGQLQDAVTIDGKSSQLNRVEQQLQSAIDDGHPILARLPRLVVTYEDRDGGRHEYTELELPHRVFDAHVRAGSVGEAPVPELDSYRAMRNATPTHARPLLDASPASLVFGGWDASRFSRQWRGRSLLRGTITGFCAQPDPERPERTGGGRMDPVGQRIELSPAALKALAQRQRHELSSKTYEALTSGTTQRGQQVKAATTGLGGVPPRLDTLGQVACHTILRTHVFSFAALRQLRFDAGPDGDAACRALLAALALNGLARSDAELVVRAGCDLVEAAPSEVSIDQRGGRTAELSPLTIPAADTLLADALAHAEQAAGVEWNGPVLRIAGDPAIVGAAVDDGTDDETDNETS